MLETEFTVIIGFAIVLVFSWLGNRQGKPANPIS